MPTKKQALQTSADDIAIVYQKEYEFGDKKVKFTLDARNYEDLLTKFQIRLEAIRDIKGEADFPLIQHSDPVFDVAYKNLIGMRDDAKRIETAKRIAIQHYLKLSQQTYVLAGLLALSHGNIFENEPVPYDEDLEESIDGLGDPLPVPKPDLSNPTEYRLKQLFDILDRDPILTRTVLKEVQDATTNFEQRVKAGQLDGTRFR
jgi:hypothetical protein